MGGVSGRRSWSSEESWMGGVGQVGGRSHRWSCERRVGQVMESVTKWS